MDTYWVLYLEKQNKALNNFFCPRYYEKGRKSVYVLSLSLTEN